MGSSEGARQVGESHTTSVPSELVELSIMAIPNCLRGWK